MRFFFEDNIKRKKLKQKNKNKYSTTRGELGNLRNPDDRVYLSKKARYWNLTLFADALS